MNYQLQSLREHSSYLILGFYFGYHCSLQHSDHLTITCTSPCLPAELTCYFADKQCIRSFSDWNIEEYVFGKIDFRFCWTVAAIVYGQRNMIEVYYLEVYFLFFCWFIQFIHIHSKLNRITLNFDEQALIIWIFYSCF